MGKRKNVLLVSSTASMIDQFNQRNIDILVNLGYTVVVAANFSQPGTISSNAANELRSKLEKSGIKVIDVPFNRGMGNFSANIKAMKALNRILSRQKYDFIHVHAALASVLTRIVAFFNDVPVLYTAHGFQFMRGGLIRRWAVFFPIEWMLSYVTNKIITINDEDYALAGKYFKSQVIQVNGVGIDCEKFENKKISDHKMRNELGIPFDASIFLTVGELSYRKNQMIALDALATLDSKKWHYVLIGTGDYKDILQKKSEQLGISENVTFLGYQRDVAKFYKLSDFGLYPSRLEGLLTAGMESLASGLPVIGSNVRGVRDLIVDGKNGFILKENNLDEFSNTLNVALQLTDKEKCNLEKEARKSARQYDKKSIDEEMTRIYLEMGE